MAVYADQALELVAGEGSGPGLVRVGMAVYADQALEQYVSWSWP